jgi:hypothetical protein
MVKLFLLNGYNNKIALEADLDIESFIGRNFNTEEYEFFDECFLESRREYDISISELHLKTSFKRETQKNFERSYSSFDFSRTFLEDVITIAGPRDIVREKEEFTTFLYKRPFTIRFGKLGLFADEGDCTMYYDIRQDFRFHDRRIKIWNKKIRYNPEEYENLDMTSWMLEGYHMLADDDWLFRETEYPIWVFPRDDFSSIAASPGFVYDIGIQLEKTIFANFSRVKSDLKFLNDLHDIQGYKQPPRLPTLSELLRADLEDEDLL